MWTVKSVAEWHPQNGNHDIFEGYVHTGKG